MTYLERLHIEHKERLARINAKALPDKPMECVSALTRSQRAPERHLKKIDQLNAAEYEAWYARQIEKFKPPEMKRLWFSIADQQEEPSISTIKHLVCAHYGVTKRDIESAHRTRDITFPRQVAMYLCRRRTSKSHPDIGRRFGGRDHTTVLHAVKKIELLVGRDANLRATIDNLIQQIEGQSDEANTHSPDRLPAEAPTTPAEDH